MLYACYNYHEEPKELLKSLMDSLKGRIAIDMVRLTGPDFEHIDNRLLCLWIVKYKLSEVAMFGPDGRSVHPSEFLYRKDVLVVRGSYRPPTLVNLDMIKASNKQFRKEEKVDASRTFLLTEITMDNLYDSGELDEKVQNDYISNIPLKRFGQGNDVANACVFLGSDMSSYITGQVMSVCGGMNI